MVVCLVSRDADLLPQLLGCGETTVLHAQSEKEIPQANLYIWDFESCPQVWMQVAHRDAAQHLVVAGSRYENDINACLPPSASVLLKPVTSVTLQAFISLASNTWRRTKRTHEERVGKANDPLLQSIRDITSRLQQCDPDRERVIARAVHDFRSSLTALNGYCGLLIDGQPSGPKFQQTELISRMRYSVKRLARLSADVIHLLGRGAVDRAEKFSTGSIERCVVRALSIVGSLVEEKRISVSVNLEEPFLSFNSEQIERLFIHLLESACKFTPDGGTIEIRGHSVGRTPESSEAERSMDSLSEFMAGYRVDVRDSGQGITSESADTMFDLYASSDTSTGRAGAGLGFAICKLIVSAHAGSIWAVPHEEGGQISIVLPTGQRTVRPEKDSFGLRACIN